MAALAADRRPPVAKQMDFQEGGWILDYGVMNADIIYKGAFVEVDAQQYAAPVGAGDTSVFLGLALEQADNSAGVDGDINVKILVGAVIEHAIGSIAIASVGSIIYASDDQTLTLVTTSNLAMGWLIGVPVTGTAIVKMKVPGPPIS